MLQWDRTTFQLEGFSMRSFVLCIVLLLTPQAKASITWEFESVTAGFTGTIVFDETKMVPFGEALGLGSGIVKWFQFTDYTGRNYDWANGLWVRFGADPADPSQARFTYGYDLSRDINLFINLSQQSYSPNLTLILYTTPGMVDAYSMNLNFDIQSLTLVANDGVLRLVTPEPGGIAIWGLLVGVVGLRRWR
jgi:hypothetical protein